ncbi:hypothetical protein HMPREF1144_1421 [Klebsiella sp. OBRC7]|nr:hypothetical protein HMPREF1144_1421 [Klebsiella sp. OBRC7]
MLQVFFDLMQGCLWVNQDGINRINNNAGFNNVIFSLRQSTFSVTSFIQ